MRDMETQTHTRESETNRDQQDRDLETVSQKNRQAGRAGVCWGRDSSQATLERWEVGRPEF